MEGEGGGLRANLVIGWAEVRRRRDDFLSQVKFGQGEEQWYVFAFYFSVNLGFNLGSYTVENLLYHSLTCGNAIIQIKVGYEQGCLQRNTFYWDKDDASC